ncbi:MAG: hypothetical protein JXO44_01720 [Clostridia bacterium]|nr:hypothetical protein [Clostridia bacterium]
MGNYKFSVQAAIAIILVTVAAIGTCLVMGWSMVFGFWVAIAVTLFMLRKKGALRDEIIRALYHGIWACRSIYAVILLIGVTITTWIASGVVPMLIYYGFLYIEGMNFLLASFVILMLLSYVLGTAIGTISTVGVALYGIGIGFGIPQEIIVGTLVSGAFIADKISPMSGLMNLTLETVGGYYKAYIKEQLKTLSIGIMIALVFYFFLGSQYTTGQLGESALAFCDGVTSIFHLSPWLVVFPVMVVVLALSGLSTIRMMSICAIFGSGVALFYQHIPFNKLITWVIHGVSLESGISAVDGIIKGGGILPMTEVILIVLSAVALSSLFELGSVFEPLIGAVVGDTKNPGQLMSRTAVLSILLTSLTCDQTVGIIVPAKQLKGRFLEVGLTEVQLASVISDSGTIIAPVEFWNVNALIIMAIFAMNPIHYVPYAVLCYAMPLVVIIKGVIKSKLDGESRVNSYE